MFLRFPKIFGHLKRYSTCTKNLRHAEAKNEPKAACRNIVFSALSSVKNCPIRSLITSATEPSSADNKAAKRAGDCLYKAGRAAKPFHSRTPLRKKFARNGSSRWR